MLSTQKVCRGEVFREGSWGLCEEEKENDWKNANKVFVDPLPRSEER